MAPAWGHGVATVVGPVGLLVVLLIGGCAAEGKREHLALCVLVGTRVPTSSQGPPVLPNGASVLHERGRVECLLGTGS